MPPPPRWMLIAGERRRAALASEPFEGQSDNDTALVYGFAGAASRDAFSGRGWESLGPAPALVRPLRLSYLGERLPPAVRSLVPRAPLLAPFGRQRRKGVREITMVDPRITRLWGRFSVDVRVATERDARFLGWRVFDRPDGRYRVMVFEDGDRYAIRAMCVFTVREEERGVAGYVMELLHDRSVDGMRGASHLLGLALREMSDAGADVARAWSLPHSGSFPIYARHAFFRGVERSTRGETAGVQIARRHRDSQARQLHFGVRAVDPAIEDIVMQREHWYLSYLDSGGV